MSEEKRESTALVIAERGAFIPQTLKDAEAMATRLAESSLVPEHFQGKPANCFWAMALGADVGLSPTQALQSIYVIKGKPSLYADAMHAIVLAHPSCVRFDCVKSTAAVAKFETVRRQPNGKPGAVREKTVTIEDAHTAGWTRNEKYKLEPARMLEARCKSWLAKLVYPDVLKGLHCREELETSIDMVETDSGVFVAPEHIDADVVDDDSDDTAPADVAELSDHEREVIELREILMSHDWANEKIGADVIDRLNALKKGPARDELRDIWRTESGKAAKQ